ncbi:MAG: hypothetical protein WA966_02420 [Ornithinimicrobium sp.]
MSAIEIPSTTELPLLQAPQVPQVLEVLEELPIRVEALKNLPEAPRGSDPFYALAAAFLMSYPPNTARAYTADLKTWAQRCAEIGVHPFEARRQLGTSHDPNPQARTSKPAAPATVARRLSCLAKLYECAIADVELLTYSPWPPLAVSRPARTPPPLVSTLARSTRSSPPPRTTAPPLQHW